MKKYLLLTFLLLSNAFALFADDPGLPCPDPDVPCPIDTWVIGFAVLTLIITVAYLYKKQAKAIKATEQL